MTRLQSPCRLLLSADGLFLFAGQTGGRLAALIPLCAGPTGLVSIPPYMGVSVGPTPVRLSIMVFRLSAVGHMAPLICGQSTRFVTQRDLVTCTACVGETFLVVVVVRSEAAVNGAGGRRPCECPAIVVMAVAAVLLMRLHVALVVLPLAKCVAPRVTPK